MNDATTDSGAVWKREKDEGRYMYARDGDMWAMPFQCEFCWIVNLKRREYRAHDPQDVLLCAYLRRFNLNVMWSKESRTVGANLRELLKGARMSHELGLNPLNLPRGPWPVDDPYGCQIGLEILRASQLKGRHSPDYQQFDTICKIRAGFSIAYESSPLRWNLGNLVFKAEHILFRVCALNHYCSLTL